jgi:5-methylcytosine-specific restriction endonuclease McrA
MSVAPHVRRRRRKREYALKQLGYRTYSDYTRSAHWRDVKARYRASDLPQACRCGEEKVQYHHKTYERLGAEELTDIEPLCSRCHTVVHSLERRGDMSLDPAELDSPDRAAAYAEERAPAQAKAETEFHTDERQREHAEAVIERHLRQLKHLRSRVVLSGEDVSDAEFEETIAQSRGLAVVAAQDDGSSQRGGHTTS